MVDAECSEVCTRNSASFTHALGKVPEDVMAEAIKFAHEATLVFSNYPNSVVTFIRFKSTNSLSK